VSPELEKKPSGQVFDVAQAYPKTKSKPVREHRMLEDENDDFLTTSEYFP
jgi:hypothetical protein